ncbi:hypothetical protein GGI06_005562, partial [Coemansia sp. S85]
LAVESLCGAAVARVGEPLALSYRLTNLTRRTRTVAVAMHAAEAFVFAGPRRLTLSVLPGHHALLRFRLLPLVAAVPAGAAFAPGAAVFQEKGNASGQGWVLLPRLEITDAAPLPAIPSPAGDADGPPPAGAVGRSGLVPVLGAAAELAGDRPLSPGLAEQCADMLPLALVYGGDRGESDFEDSDGEEEGPTVKKLAIPSTVILTVACTFFLCIIIISRSAIHTRQSHSLPDAHRPQHPPIDPYDWKRPIPKPRETPDTTSWVPDLPLVRLEGWPTEFPDDLDQYREDVLDDEWASDEEKHRAEIAPWVWHHRGDADLLQSLALSNDSAVAERAREEMAVRGI